MIKTPADLHNHNLIRREQAALIAGTASRFQSTLTLERDGITLNLKSMIGLLSQTIPKDGQMWLVADGEDEEAATKAVLEVLLKQSCTAFSMKTLWKRCAQIALFLFARRFLFSTIYFPYRMETVENDVFPLFFCFVCRKVFPSLGRKCAFLKRNGMFSFCFLWQRQRKTRINYGYRRVFPWVFQGRFWCV